MRRKTWIAAGVFVILLLSALGYEGYRAYATVNPDDLKAAQLAATRGIVLMQTIQSYWRVGGVLSPLSLQPEALAAFNGVKPATPLHRLPRALPNGPTLLTKISLPDAEVQTWKRHAQSLVDDLYVPNSPASALISRALDWSAEETSHGYIITLDAGVQHVDWNQTVLNGDEATLSGSADFWAAMAQWQNGRGYVVAAPHNVMLLTVTLHRTDGTWKIFDIKMDFAPGSEP